MPLTKGKYDTVQEFRFRGGTSFSLGAVALPCGRRMIAIGGAGAPAGAPRAASYRAGALSSSSRALDTGFHWTR
nr:hypothetical protein [Bradyrhizobium sp. CCBAU 51765]